MNAMRLGAWVACLVLTSWCRAGDDPPSGLYAMSWDGAGREVKRADTADGVVFLGRQLSPTLRNATIVS
jgi:hypothetical protein